MSGKKRIRISKIEAQMEEISFKLDRISTLSRVLVESMGVYDGGKYGDYVNIALILEEKIERATSDFDEIMCTLRI